MCLAQVKQAIAERNIMASTSNPFVVKLFFAFESETKLYFVMEYVIGGDCRSSAPTMAALSAAALINALQSIFSRLARC